MKLSLTRIRYYLEIISVPIFAFLVIHLAGHGLMLLAESDHEHGHEEEHGHESILDLEFLLSTEVLGGLLVLILFTWIWHQKPFKKLVPCSHDHCHHSSVWPHLLASIAFVFHFFPESQVRYELLQELSLTSILNVLGLIGFLSHFFVDIIIMILLASFWKKAWQKAVSLGTMVAFWGLAFWVGENGGLHLEGLAEPILLLFSAFLLAMFIHKPHLPEPVCTSCDD